MKLPKYNSVTFDQNIMKLKYLLPFYLLLASITFCSRTASDKKEKTMKAETATTEAAATVSPGIAGTLELDTVTNIIHANLVMGVTNRDFKYSGNFMPLETPDGYKGISFMYFDTVKNIPDNGKPSAAMRIKFSFSNTGNWKINDSVRIMSLDEDEKATFEGLKPYFEQRMAAFKNAPISLEQLQAFNAAWNANNKDNPVTGPTEVSGPKKRKPDQDVFIPRLTKDDIILSLKRKR